MKNQKHITISEEELKFIAQDEFKKIMDVAIHNSYCRKCFGDKVKSEMHNYKISLNRINDLLFQGYCKTCDSKMNRCIELYH